VLPEGEGYSLPNRLNMSNDRLCSTLQLQNFYMIHTFILGRMVRMPGARIRSARMFGPGWLIGTLRGGPASGPTSIQVTVSKTLSRIHVLLIYLMAL
jgi:hypothetical protein